KGLISVGDGCEPQRGDVILHAHWRLQDRVGAEHVVVRQAQELLADAIAVAQAEVSDAADLVRGLAALDPAFGNRRMPVRQAVEIAHARPDPIIARIDEGRAVDPCHDALRSFLARPALGGRLTARRRRGWGRSGLGLATALARGLADALHVARLSNETWHFGEASAFDADVGKDRVD